MREKISAIIVTRDRRKELDECISSLYKSSLKPFEVIVVDNHSETPVSSWLKKKFPKVKIFRTDKNVGAAAGRNIGIVNAKGDYYLFMDDDAYAHKDMIEYMMEVFKKRNNAGVVQPKVMDKDRKNLVQGAGHRMNMLTGMARAWGLMEPDHGQYDEIREIPMVGGICIFKKEVIDKIGMFDEDYFIPYEDTDLSYRALKAGFGVYCYGKAAAYHPSKKMKVHPLLEWMGITIPERAYRVPRNKMIFMRKHATTINFIIFLFVFVPMYAVLHTTIILIGRRLDILLKYWQGVFSGLKYALLYNKALWLKVILSIFLIFSATYLTVKPSFNFSLFGDDWLGLYTVKFNYGPGTTVDYTTFRGFLGPYAIPIHLMALISHFWGYNHQVYYIFVYLLRSLAATSVFFLAYKMTKTTFAALVAGVLFGVSVSGIETVSWGGWNMATYLAVFFFCISFWFSITSHKNWSRYLVSLLLLIFSVASFPQRMHGAILFFAFADFIWLIRNFKLKNFGRVTVRFLLLLVVTYFLTKFNTFGGEGDRAWLLGQITSNLSTEKYYFWTSLVSSFGNFFIPNTFWVTEGVSRITSSIIGNSLIFPRSKPFFIIFTGVIFLITFLLKKNKFKFFALSFTGGLLWTLYLRQAISDPLSSLLNLSVLFSLFFGGYLLIVLLSWLLIVRRAGFVYYLLLIISWPFVMGIIPWSRNNFSSLETVFRYSTIPGIVFPLLSSLLISKLYGVRRTLVIVLVCVLGAIQFSFANAYLGNLSRARDAKLFDSAWNQLITNLNQEGYKPTSKLTVVYIEGDPEVTYSVFLFGFPPKMAITYDLPEQVRNEIPIYVNQFSDLLLVTNNGSYPASGQKPQIVPADRIYAFRLEGDRLVNIKKDVLEKLRLNRYPL
ncbi:MAG TPA: glycosyltransferase family 2 protein [Patescibacteria group bacterium]